MSYHHKIQLTAVIVAPPDQAAEGERIFQSHAPWMAATHHRAGDTALLSYSVSKTAELSNPWDLNSPLTGNTCFVLTEIYETTAGVSDHFEQAAQSWKDFPAMGAWMQKCTVTFVSAAPIVNALW